MSDFHPKKRTCRCFDDNSKYEILQKYVRYMLCSFMRTEAPKNYMKMLLFSTSAVAVLKGPRNEEKRWLIKL